MKSITSSSEKHFVESAIRKGLRLDGRTLGNGRSVEIAFSESHGCCIVMLGNTRVLAQVSCEITTPNPARPSEGTLHVNFELSPMADPEFKGAGSMSDEAIEAVRLLERCIRDSRCVDLESLCIVSGVKVWTIRVDVQALNNDGNITECASIATIAALAHFRRPHVSVIGTDVTVHSLEDHNPVPLTLHHMPVIVNLAIYDNGEYVVVDPVELEERVALGSLVIGINAHQEICLLHFSGPVSLRKETVVSCTEIAAKRAQTLTQIIRTSLDNDSYQRATNQPTGFTSLLRTSTILGAKRPISQINSSNLSLEETVYDVDEDDDVEEDSGSQFTSSEPMTSNVRRDVQKFLEKTEAAIFEGGKSRWQLDDEDESSEEDDEEEEEEEIVVKSEPTSKKTKKKTNKSVHESDSEEEEKVFLKSTHVDGDRPARGWYSRDALF